MKLIMLILTIGIISSCSSSTAKEVDSDQKVTTETSQKIKEAQEVNIELEAIDGELDSLLNLVK